METYALFMMTKINIVKMKGKIHYRINVIRMDILLAFFKDIDQMPLTFISSNKIPTELQTS